MMVEVTRQNFMNMYPKIEYSIRSAEFISIDTEFTGLYYNDACKPSLFDSSAERYAKLRTSVQKFTLSQIGLTTFSEDAGTNKYHAETFHFHLCPLPFGSHDQRFCIQASSSEFLCKHNFDFNKWFYEGLPYLNEVQEKEMEEELESGLLFAGIERAVDEKELQGLCSQVAAWLSSCDIGDCLTLTIDGVSAPLLYIYHKDLRRRFSQIWTSTNAFDQVVVERVEPAKREKLEKQSRMSDKKQEKLHLMEMLGFTLVFRLLLQTQKPLVGHNMLMDLIFMYDKFHKPLPDSYLTFKEEVHRMFPALYDTKNINHTLRKPLESLELFRASNLQELYFMLNSQRILSLTLLQPHIQLVNSEHVYEAEHPHHAGYDSYLCGCVFLRFCHLLHFRNVSSMDTKACPFKDYLPTMKDFCNRVNVIRAMVNHINFDGSEPPSQRPPLIFVETIKPGMKLVPQQLAVWFSMYGTVDIQMISSTQAVVATGNYMRGDLHKRDTNVAMVHCLQCKNHPSWDALHSHLVDSISSARDIIYAFQDHGTVRVTKYRFWEHSRLGQGIVLGSLAVATGACALLLINVFR